MDFSIYAGCVVSMIRSIQSGMPFNRTKTRLEEKEGKREK
jgi:hypothetical protein